MMKTKLMEFAYKKCKIPTHHHEWVTLSKFLGFFPSNILTLHYNMPILYSKVE